MVNLLESEILSSHRIDGADAIQGARLCTLLTAGSMMSTSISAGSLPVLTRISRAPGGTQKGQCGARHVGQWYPTRRGFPNGQEAARDCAGLDLHRL